MKPTEGTLRHVTSRRDPQPGAADVAPGAVWGRRHREVEWSRERGAALVELVGRLTSGRIPERIPGRALDLGCGPGRNAVWLAHQGWTVTGVDTSAVALAEAALRARDAGGSLELGQVDGLTYVPPAVAARVWRCERAPNGAEGPVVEVVA